MGVTMKNFMRGDEKQKGPFCFFWMKIFSITEKIRGSLIYLFFNFLDFRGGGEFTLVPHGYATAQFHSYFQIPGKLLLSILSLGLVVQLNPYYVVLIAPIILQFKAQKFSAVLLFIFAIISIYGVNFIFVSNPHDLFRNTLKFL